MADINVKHFVIYGTLCIYVMNEEHQIMMSDNDSNVSKIFNDPNNNCTIFFTPKIPYI